MDIAAIQGFLDQEDHAARSRAFQYFEQLKSTDTGWQLSIDCLLSGQPLDEPTKFFCFQILTSYAKTRYLHEDLPRQQIMRDFINRWIHMQSLSSSESLVIRKKAAHLICMVFLADYPLRWLSFFEDLLQTLNYGHFAVDIYLRVLLAINSEIADRETTRNQKELELFTLIKDTMRDNCVKNLVDSWHHILVTYHQSQQRDLVCLCLQVIGAYIAWININLIANEHFVSVFVTFLSVPHVRDSTCDCITEIINKGMDPMAKIKLVESFVVVLEQARVLSENDDDDNDDFDVKLGYLVNGMGTMVLNSWTKLQKLHDGEGVSLAANSVRSKVNLLLKFLNDEDEEVSQTVIEFAREYLQFLKHQASVGAYTAEDISNVEAILFIVINRYKYDKSANFLVQRQEEAMFECYRKSLKNIFDNLALLDVNIVFTRTKEMIVKTLQHWQSLPFEDVEVAVTFLYLLGEIVPVYQGNSLDQSATEERRVSMAEMVCMLVNCGVSNHSHTAVTLQFFETVVRFEKFFAQEPQHIPEILVAFMDSRGLRNANSPHIRSRTSYLFSRLIKSLKAQVQTYTEDILNQLQDLLVLRSPENGMNAGLLSPDDQLYLYETTAILILSGQFDSQRKQKLLKDLLTPVFEKFAVLLQKLQVITDKKQRHVMAKCMNHAIAVTSRTSKAFSSQLTMKTYGCVDIYLKALEVFLGALSLPYEQQTLQSAVRQYLHRMVVCLEDEVLPYFPMASEQLLKNSDIRSIQEFVPLINQIISKFKKKIVPFLQQIFMPLVSIIFNALSAPIEEGDQPAQSERQLLQRSYFLFISAIVTNDTTEVIATQEIQNLQQVLLTIIQGAVDFPDPVAQKTCFSILKKMVELWGGPDGVVGFVEFMYSNIVPACFMAPMKSTFDLNDAQTILALSETALCLKMVWEKRGNEFLTYLQTQYLPTLHISSDQIQEYCQALKSDNKAFKAYLKFFFQRARQQ